MHTRFTGQQGEDLAAEFITNQLGWHIIDRNLHYRLGEIDILADAGNTIAIIEVKAKKHQKQGLAIEMITPQKQRRLRLLARWIEGEYNKPVRVDVIAIDDFLSSNPRIQHYPFAVEEI